MNRLAPALVLLVLAAPSSADVFDVTKTADTFDGACDADCSLREAVAAANAQAGEDAVLLGPGVYTLTRAGAFEDSGVTGDLDVRDDLVILGAGADRTILDGNGTDRILHGLADARLEIHDLTIRNGRAMSRTSPSPVAGTGGGISSGGSVRLSNTLITGNRAAYGGGVWAFHLTARDTTISDNAADQNGGGISDAPELDLRNVTISGNRATDSAGGLYLRPGEQVLDQVTVTGNRAAAAGGIRIETFECPGPCPSFLFRLTRSVVAGNAAPVSPECDNLPEPDGGFNVFGAAAGCNPGATDRVDGDPKLSPLGDHGGPTPTHLPLPGSPVLDFAPDCSATDQRGAPRPAEGCDAGAVEVTGACIPGAASLCLQNGRFRASATWKTATGQGAAQAVPLTSDTGAFWFFNPANLELTLKVLDGCAVNDRFWVFVTGLTDVQVEIRVEDTQTGVASLYTSPGKTPFEPRLDTNAFLCP